MRKGAVHEELPSKFHATEQAIKNFLLVSYDPCNPFSEFTLLFLYLFLHICFHVSKFITFSRSRHVYSVLRCNHQVLLVLRPQRCNYYLMVSIKRPEKGCSLPKDLLDECIFDWSLTEGYMVNKNYKGNGRKKVCFKLDNICCRQQRTPTYRLFQTLLLLFWTIICMI